MRESGRVIGIARLGISAKMERLPSGSGKIEALLTTWLGVGGVWLRP